MNADMKHPEISIVVPVYNADRYLEECLASIQGQIFRDFEVLMINDGSTDSSEEICERYQRNDGRFILISQANAGVCRARNKGLKQSRGEYIAFVDSDDRINEDFLSSLHGALTETDSDIAVCDFYNERGKETANLRYRILDGDEILYAFQDGEIYNRIMNKLYRRTTVEGLPFPEDRVILEDACWTAHVLEKAGRVVILPEGRYFYRFVEDSLSRKKFNDQEKAMMYRNKLERYIVIARHSSNAGEERTIRLINEIKSYLEVIFIASNDLEMKDVHGCMKRLIAIPMLEQTHQAVFDDIRRTNDSRELHRKCLKEMLLRRNISARLRLLALYRLTVIRHKEMAR